MKMHRTFLEENVLEYLEYNTIQKYYILMSNPWTFLVRFILYLKKQVGCITKRNIFKTQNMSLSLKKICLLPFLFPTLLQGAHIIKITVSFDTPAFNKYIYSEIDEKLSVLDAKINHSPLFSTQNGYHTMNSGHAIPFTDKNNENRIEEVLKVKKKLLDDLFSYSQTHLESPPEKSRSSDRYNDLFGIPPYDEKNYKKTFEIFKRQARDRVKDIISGTEQPKGLNSSMVSSNEVNNIPGMNNDPFEKNTHINRETDNLSTALFLKSIENSLKKKKGEVLLRKLQYIQKIVNDQLELLDSELGTTLKVELIGKLDQRSRKRGRQVPLCRKNDLKTFFKQSLIEHIIITQNEDERLKEKESKHPDFAAHMKSYTKDNSVKSQPLLPKMTPFFLAAPPSEPENSIIEIFGCFSKKEMLRIERIETFFSGNNKEQERKDKIPNENINAQKPKGISSKNNNHNNVLQHGSEDRDVNAVKLDGPFAEDSKQDRHSKDGNQNETGDTEKLRGILPKETNSIDKALRDLIHDRDSKRLEPSRGPSRLIRQNDKPKNEESPPSRYSDIQNDHEPMNQSHTGLKQTRHLNTCNDMAMANNCTPPDDNSDSEFTTPGFYNPQKRPTKNLMIANADFKALKNKKLQDEHLIEMLKDQLVNEALDRGGGIQNFQNSNENKHQPNSEFNIEDDSQHILGNDQSPPQIHSAYEPSLFEFMPHVSYYDIPSGDGNLNLIYNHEIGEVPFDQPFSTWNTPQNDILYSDPIFNMTTTYFDYSTAQSVDLPSLIRRNTIIQRTGPCRTKSAILYDEKVRGFLSPSKYGYMTQDNDLNQINYPYQRMPDYVNQNPSNEKISEIASSTPILDTLILHMIWRTLTQDNSKLEGVQHSFRTSIKRLLEQCSIETINIKEKDTRSEYLDDLDDMGIKQTEFKPETDGSLNESNQNPFKTVDKTPLGVNNILHNENRIEYKNNTINEMEKDFITHPDFLYRTVYDNKQKDMHLKTPQGQPGIGIDKPHDLQHRDS